MSSLRLSRRLLAFVSLCLCNLASGLGPEPFQVKFRVVEEMIVVPVTINGAGPFDFLLDTANTQTVVDRKLAEELHLPPAGKTILVTASGKAVTPLAHTDSLSMPGATVRGLNLSVVNHYADLRPKVRGNLGEDFLQYFDLLIDNQHHLIQFELGPGPLTDMMTGQHLPLSLNGINEQKLTRDRLIVVGQIYELGNKNMKLQLDSGTRSTLLFSTLNKFNLISTQLPTHSVEGILGGSLAADVQTARFLRLGDKLFPHLTVIVLRDIIPPMDIDGLLPTSLFRSIFISHSGGFVILDPVLAQSKSPSRPGTEISDVQSPRMEPPASR
jgi:hypothetical protein